MDNMLSTKNVVAAEDLRGPRVYSTDLLNDPTVSYEGSPRVAATALKIKLISRGLVTINSKHLFSPLAIQLIENDPDLLSGPGFIAAVEVTAADPRSEAEMAKEKQGWGIDSALLDDHVATIQEGITQVMPWDVSGVEDRFKIVLDEGLRNPQSHISQILREQGVSEDRVHEMAEAVGDLDLSRSAELWTYVEALEPRIKASFERFARSAYHIVGTSVVRCETGTDLHPLSAFKSTDALLAGRDASVEMLSDEAIFLGAFMGYARSAIQTAAFPAEIIEALTFKDAHRLGHVLRAQGFQSGYEDIVQEYARVAQLPDSTEALDALDVDKIKAVAENLAKRFKASIIDELPNYQTALENALEEDIIEVSADIVKDGAGQIPGVNNFIAAVDAIGHATELAKLGWTKARIRNATRLRAEAARRREKKIEHAIGNLRLSGMKRATLLDAAALISDIHQMRRARA